jgi:5-methylcytosine-specific restriction protein A
MSKTRRSRGVWSTPRPLGPNGEKLCYNCRGLLPKGRPYNCSPECSEEWRTKTSPSYMRFRLFERDKGICSLCGLDTVALYEEYRKLPHSQGWDELQTDERRTFLRVHGIPSGRTTTDWWDADHIVPVIEGGGECGLANFRTLCIPCHQKVTRELHSREKARRKEEKIQAVALPLFDQEEDVTHKNTTDTTKESVLR